MATYILLGTLTDEGHEKLRKNPGWVDDLNHDLSEMGVDVISQFAVLGPYDIVTIIDAPDNKTVVHVSAQLTLHGSIKITTLPAISIQDFLAALK
jgi:uncharacterized protein with GYD domain